MQLTTAFKVFKIGTAVGALAHASTKLGTESKYSAPERIVSAHTLSGVGRMAGVVGSNTAMISPHIGAMATFIIPSP